jgi:hypothetical protein
MNLVSLQERLRDFSEDQLATEMQRPTGQVPQFLVLTELNRRKRMRDEYQLDSAQGDQPTVAQDLLAAAGMPAEQMGQMAGAMAPQTDMMGNTGAAGAPQPQIPPQRMRDGGIVALQSGGFVGAEGTRQPRSYVRDGIQYIVDDRGREIPWGVADVTVGANMGMGSRTVDIPGGTQGMGALLPSPEPDAARNWSPTPAIFAPRGGASGMPRFPDPPELSDSPSPLQRFATPDMETPDFRAAGMPSAMGIDPMAGVSPLAPEEGGAPATPGGSGVSLPWWLQMDPAAAPGEAMERILFPGRDPEEIRRRRSTPADAAPPTPGMPVPDVETPAASGVPPTPPPPAPQAPAAGIAGLAPPGAAVPSGGAPPPPGAAPGSTAPGSFEEFLQQRMEAADADRRRDKWLSLAQFGLALMASNQPTLGGAVGEAGSQAIESLRGSYRDYNETMMQLYSTREQLAQSREQMELRRASLAARGSGDGERPMRPQDHINLLRLQLDAASAERERLAPTGVPQPENADAYGRATSMQDTVLRRLAEMSGLPSADAAGAGVIWRN